MPAKKDPKVLLLDKDAFDDLVKNRVGIKRQRDVAERLEIRESVLSLYRNRKRTLNGATIAALMDLFPGVMLQSYTVRLRLSEIKESLQ